MKKNKYIQLSLFDHLEDQNLKRVLFEIDKIMRKNLDEFKTDPPSMEKLEYIRDFLKAYKEGGLLQVKSEDLEVGGPKYNLTKKHEDVLCELISSLEAQIHTDARAAKLHNHKKA